MKTSVLPATLVALMLLGTGRVGAQAFDSGSNGSFGELVVPASTTRVIDLPPDGILHCTTVSMGNNSTLRFNRNALNTPVHLLAQGDVVINPGAVIDIAGAPASGAIAGRGGPGGFDGGYGGFGPTAPASRGGDGYGPGRGINASNREHAVHAGTVNLNTSTYGNALCMPLIGGSGGAGSSGNPGTGGGGGGGALVIASSTSIVLNGRITAEGGFGSGRGSGGAVRLIAPTGGGNGFIQNLSLAGNQGRVRIDTTNPNAFRNLSLEGSVTRGRQMVVFPPSPASLHLVEVAGQAIGLDAGATVTVNLPVGAPTTQTVRIRAQGFTGEVPVRLVVTPEHSASSVFDLVIPAGANPAEVSTEITLPVGEPTRVEAWTR